MRTKIPALTRHPRIARTAAALVVVATFSLANSAGPVSARPADDGVSTSSTTCQIYSDFAKTVYGVHCVSDWPWENFYYQAWVRCTDNRTYYGLAQSSFWHPGWSYGRCPEGHHYVNAGRA